MAFTEKYDPRAGYRFTQSGSFLSHTSTLGLDAKVGIASFWGQVTQAGSTFRSWFYHDNLRIFTTNTNSNIEFWARTTGNTLSMHVKSSALDIDDGDIHHFLCSWDLAASAIHLHIDDSSDADIQANLDNALGYSESDTVRISSHAVNNAWVIGGNVWEMYVNTAEYLDFSVEANRRKFISAAGTPVDLGPTGEKPTGNQPVYYVKGTGAVGANLGSNTDLALTGTSPAVVPGPKYTYSGKMVVPYGNRF